MLTFTHVCPQPAVYLTRYDRIAPDVLGASARSLGKQNSPPLSGSFAQDAADATVADQCKNSLICCAILAGQAQIKFLSRAEFGFGFGFGFGISNLEMYCNSLRPGSFRSLRTYTDIPSVTTL